MHRNLLFDLDQTLLDFHASEHLALKLVMEENGLSFSEEHYKFFKNANKNLWLEFEKGKITKTELFEARFRQLFRHCRCETSGIDFLKINSDFIDCMAQNGVPLEGAHDLLKKITDSVPGARIYVITNGVTRNAMGRINSTDLDRYLSGVFISEEIGAAKPSADYFKAVKNAVGEPIESFIVIGDSLSSDMLGAKNASLASCWFMPEGNIAEAVKRYDIDFTASSFDELYEIISKWSAGVPAM